MEAESGGREGSNAVVWLKDAGLDYLISNKGAAGNEEIDEKAAMVMFGSLTRRQSIAVQKRLKQATNVGLAADKALNRRRGNGPSKSRGNSISSDSPLAGRLVASLSGPLDTPTPQKSCVSIAVTSNLLNAARRSGSYDLGKLNLADTPSVVLKSRRHVDIIEAYDNCNPAETSCVYREEEKRARSPSTVSAPVTVFEGFPVFSFSPCDLGITLACHDLSKEDLVVVRRMSFIEASTMFDELNIKTSGLSQPQGSSTSSLMGLLSGKNTSKNTASASSLPNTSLEALLGKNKSRAGSGGQAPRVPLLIERILAELCSSRCANTEGIFRIPPSQQRLRVLLQSVQSNEISDSQFDLSEVPPSDLAALFKHIIRSLTPSLLTASLEPQFLLAVSDIPGDFSALQSVASSVTQPAVTIVPPSNVVRERLRLLNLLILQLPDINRDTLQLILSSLRLIAGPAANNRMTASSLALVLAPLFFPSLSHLTDADHLHRQVFAVQLLIIYADVLFVVPNSLLDQIRLHNTLLNQRNFVSGPKHTRKVASSWWRFWSRERVAARKLLSPTAGSSPVVEEQPVLTVTLQSTAALSSPKSGAKTTASELATAVQLRLKPDMKAADGIEIAVKHVKAATLPGHLWFMFEIGGNIHERCLDPQCLLLSVHKRNPSATWELRLLPDNRVLLPDPTKKFSADVSSSSVSS